MVEEEIKTPKEKFAEYVFIFCIVVGVFLFMFMMSVVIGKWIYAWWG